MAKKQQASKSDVLGKFSNDNLAVKMASAETLIINQTKEFLKNNGINLDSLDGVARKQVKRSKTILLIKNIPAKTKEAELREIFERYGTVSRFLLSPLNTIGIVEY